MDGYAVLRRLKEPRESNLLLALLGFLDFSQPGFPAMAPSSVLSLQGIPDFSTNSPISLKTPPKSNHFLFFKWHPLWWMNFSRISQDSFIIRFSYHLIGFDSRVVSSTGLKRDRRQAFCGTPTPEHPEPFRVCSSTDARQEQRQQKLIHRLELLQARYEGNRLLY